MNSDFLPTGDAFELNVWQKRQAALLYHFASLEYLKGLKHRIDALISGADVLLDEAQAQGRDALIVNERWGARDTSTNWGTYGFPALLDFQQKTAKDIAKRAHEAYSITGANQCARMLGELSMRWATEDEEESFKERSEKVYKYASYIDRVMDRYQHWNDGVVYNIWTGVESEYSSLCTPRHADLFPRLPKFRVLTDVVAEIGKRPPRSGVYVAQDDPYATLQFGWVGGETDGSLDECVTFNELGRLAVNAVGRDNLWNDSHELLEFVRKYYFKQFEDYLREERGSRFNPDKHLNDPGWASAFVSDCGITTHACKWIYVERVNDEYEEDDGEASADAIPEIQQRVPAGQACPRSGWWHTPARLGSRRRFTEGEMLPVIEDSDYGATFWLWAEDQSG